MRGVRWYFLVAKQYSLVRGSLGDEIYSQCWIPRSSAYKQLHGRYSRRVQGVADGQPNYVLPSCAPDSTSFLTHGQSQQEPCYRGTEPVARREGGEEAVVRVVRQYVTTDATNAGPVKAMRQQEGSAVRGQRLDESAVVRQEGETAKQQEAAQQPAGMTRQQEGGAVRGQQ